MVSFLEAIFVWKGSEFRSRFKRAARWLVNGVREWLADGKE